MADLDPDAPAPGGEVVAAGPGLRLGPGAELGRYLVAEELGEGGMATVYAAHDRELSRGVAVKVLLPHLSKRAEVVARFEREARAAAGLEHPNVLRIYDVGRSTPYAASYMVMEWVRGGSLAQFVETHGPLLAEAAAVVGALIADALGAAHAAGVIHRDVKPANILLAQDGRVLLSDFGVAFVEGDDGLTTRTGALLGTPAFMAPEQANGEPVDARTDVYGLGATLYRLVTGAQPYTGPTALILSQLATAAPLPADRRQPTVGGVFAKLLAHMMARVPAERMANATEVSRALRRFAADAGFVDPRHEAVSLIADPVAWHAQARPRVTARELAQGRAALAAGKLPLAMRHADRALALAPDDVGAQELAARLTRRGQGRRALWIGAALTGALAVAAGGWWALRRETASDAVVVGAVADASVSVDAGHAVDARVADAGGPADAARPVDARAPVRTRDAAGRATVMVDAIVGVDATPTARVPLPDAAPPARDGVLVLTTDTWCQLAIDDQPMGRQQGTARYPLREGAHRLTCGQGPGLRQVEEAFTIRPGADTAVRGRLLPAVAVTVALAGGLTVRIDGGAPLRGGAQLDLTVGRHQVTLADGDPVWTQWVSIPAVAACELRVAPTLGCFAR